MKNDYFMSYCISFPNIYTVFSKQASSGTVMQFHSFGFQNSNLIFHRNSFFLLWHAAYGSYYGNQYKEAVCPHSRTKDNLFAYEVFDTVRLRDSTALFQTLSQESSNQSYLLFYSILKNCFGLLNKHVYEKDSSLGALHLSRAEPYVLTHVN